MQVPEVGKIYSFNEGNYALWDEPTKAYMDSLKDPSKWGGKPYSARYIGSLVGAKPLEAGNFGQFLLFMHEKVQCNGSCDMAAGSMAQQEKLCMFPAMCSCRTEPLSVAIHVLVADSS